MHIYCIIIANMEFLKLHMNEIGKTLIIGKVMLWSFKNEFGGDNRIEEKNAQRIIHK